MKQRKLSDWSINIPELISQLNEFPINRDLIEQDRLDLANRTRMNYFPWRGQFSPELIEALISQNPDSKTLADPFAGCGTTLFEAARKSLNCFAVEINPAAVVMAKTIHFVNVNKNERRKYLDKAEEILEKHISNCSDSNLSSILYEDKIETMSQEESLKHTLLKSSEDPLTYNIVINTLFRYFSSSNKNNSSKLFSAFKKHRDIVENLPYNNKSYKVYHSDARKTPINDASVDLIITSPPYINVFNYHQNLRYIMELVGWKLLNIAKSEIGSNRKNRGNRFLTVIQYSMDILQALYEMKRIIKPNGKIIIVIGRKSKVRNVYFENYKIISALGIGVGLNLDCRQERKFVSRFGETIFEDILHFKSSETGHVVSVDFARDVAVHMLKNSLPDAKKDEVYNDIISAINNADGVHPSNLFNTKEIRKEI